MEMMDMTTMEKILIVVKGLWIMLKSVSIPFLLSLLIYYLLIRTAQKKAGRES